MPDTSRRTSVSEKTGAEIKRAKEVRLIKIAIACVSFSRLFSCSFFPGRLADPRTPLRSSVTSVYMLVELVVGYSFSALVLVADAYQ